MEKLLAIASLTQRAYGRWLFRRLFLSMIAIAGITIVIGIMVSALLIGGLVAAYFVLLSHGIEQLMAVIIVAILAILIVAMLSIMILGYLKYLRQMPQKFIKQSPLASHVIETLSAFSDGLMAD